MLKIQGLWNSYVIEGGIVPAVRGIDFTVETGEFFTLLGPSGCGKSTTLRCIAGLEDPDEGVINLGDEVLFSSKNGAFIPVHQRNIGMVFQSYAIWPHMTVYDNVEFPAKIKRMSDRKDKVMRALELVGLSGLENRSATELSGGQQQRVAIARAIVVDVGLLMFDEPLSNLDSKLRLQMRDELRQLQQKLGITSIYVTHDQEEAMVLSDRIAVMKDGLIVEIGKPREIYLRPKNLFTAQFVGQSNLIDGKISSTNALIAKVSTPIGEVTIKTEEQSGIKEGILLIRPEHVPMTWNKEDLPNSDFNVFEGNIISQTFTGKLVDYTIKVGNQLMEIQMPLHNTHRNEPKVFIHLPPERCVMLSRDGTDTH
ncbi:MAG TPA: ABC transporter ATP-binding protein [Rhodospirillales bacterium]|nr:ABC transporter ATP-binding protein [Rhodospirillales bacterium]HIC60855.1 ABC transporter ATP-binding protein [Rhodospirillales bacterium]